MKNAWGEIWERFLYENEFPGLWRHNEPLRTQGKFREKLRVMGNIPIESLLKRASTFGENSKERA